MPDDSRKTKAQLLDEVRDLRQRVDKLESMVAERRRAEAALRESEERYRSIFEFATEGIAIADVETMAFIQHRIGQRIYDGK